MVQYTKLDFVPDTSLNCDEISALWDKVDQSKLIKLKLKVRLSDELKNLVKILSDEEKDQIEFIKESEDIEKEVVETLQEDEIVNQREDSS